jgi:hypothetical protein
MLNGGVDILTAQDILLNQQAPLQNSIKTHLQFIIANEFPITG